MFGELSPRIPNLLYKANNWKKANTWEAVSTWTMPALGSTPTAANVLTNPTASTSGAQQASPATEWSGAGFNLGASTSQSIKFRSYAIGVQSSSSVSTGSWKLESSVNNSSYATALEYLTTAVAGTDFPILNITGAIKSTVNNSAAIDTLQALDLVNPSGSRVNVTARFGSTIRWGIQSTDVGTAYYKAAGSNATHSFEVGSAIGTTAEVIQVSSAGVYNYGGSFNAGRVTAGLPNTTPPAHLNSFGSLAVYGSFKNTNATLTEAETMVYVDASANAICSGTPSVTTCSTYTESGEATCISHLPCTWNPAVTEPCSTYGGVDLATCENQSGCTFDQSACSGADETSCLANDDAYGGSCSWNSCSGFTDISSCNAQSGCSATTGDCSMFGDESSCLSQAGCSWDGSFCSGTIFVSCDGNYCSGSYYNGTCSGTHTITAASCSGTVSCGSYTSSSPCAAETGCSWTTGVVITLPASSVANSSNTSRVYSIVNVGSSGTVTILPTSGGTIPDSILGYGSGVILNAQNERVMLHHHNLTSSCSVYDSNEGACTTATGCSWNAAVVCSSLMDESSCNAASGSGCTWDGSSCSGAGTASSCTGSYTSSKPWIIHQLSN